MNKFVLTTAVVMAMSATGVYAHHPSEDINPNFDLVDAQLDAVDSPHLDMDIDMEIIGNAGGVDSASGAIEDAARALSGWVSSQAQPGEASRAQPQEGPGPLVDTMDLMEDVDGALAE